jgi:hypothetical protein
MHTLPRAIHHVTRRFTERRRPDVAPLLRVPALAHADRRRLDELAPSTDVLRLPPGRTLTTAGAPASELIVLLSGEAAALAPDGIGAVLRAGAELGAPELLAYGTHPATVVALSPVDVVVVNAPAVRWAHAEGLARFAGPAPAPRRTAPAPVPAPAPAAG